MDNLENSNLEQTPQEPQVVQIDMATTQHPKKGMAIASMVLGIVSIVLSCAWYICIPCGILAIIFGVLANKEGKIGFAKAGIIMGIIGLAFAVLLLTILASILALFGDLSQYTQ